MVGMTTTTDHFTVRHDGITIPVSRGGEGRPLVLCPGLASTQADLHELIDLLRRDFDVVTFDLRGHGLSSAGDRYSFEAFFGDFVAVMAELGRRGLPAAPVLAGHSYGADLVVHYSGEYPDAVSELVVIDGANPIPEPFITEIDLPEFRVLWEDLAAWLETVEGTARQVLLTAQEILDLNLELDVIRSGILDRYRRIDRPIRVIMSTSMAGDSVEGERRGTICSGGQASTGWSASGRTSPHPGSMPVTRWSSRTLRTSPGSSGAGELPPTRRLLELLRAEETGPMLTIGELASYAGVTVRAVRHYHAKGLLPEPERDHSGYRRYDAGTVVELIRIRTLAGAGVPLARVRQLLQADAEEFAAAIADIDTRLRAEIWQRQRHRERIARLAAGDSLALPPEVVEFLDHLRALGVDERIVEVERDGWIPLVAHSPERVPELMARKRAQIAHPQLVDFYRTLGEVLDRTDNDPMLIELVDNMAAYLTQLADEQGEDYVGGGFEPSLVDLLDALALDAATPTRRLIELLKQRGWTGWTKLERVDPRRSGVPVTESAR